MRSFKDGMGEKSNKIPRPYYSRGEWRREGGEVGRTQQRQTRKKGSEKEKEHLGKRASFMK